MRQRAGGREVAGIRVRFGVRHAVDAESLAQAFSLVAEGTEAAGATVELITVPATLTCHACGHSADTTDLLAVCPRCAGTDVKLTGGDEMVLESVTYRSAPTLSLRGQGVLPKWWQCLWYYRKNPGPLSRTDGVTPAPHQQPRAPPRPRRRSRTPRFPSH